MSTILDVAKVAGVSVATVSRVLNNSTKVSVNTNQCVLEAIRKLNYQPNLLGRNLRRMESRLILVLTPNISNPYYSQIISGMEDKAHKNNYNIMLCNTNSSSKREKVFLELLYNKLSDGVIFMASELSMHEITEISKRFPVIQCCEYLEGAGVSHVSIDNYSAAYRAVKYLLSLNHKRIGMISSVNKFISTSLREKGYRQALEDEGIKFKPELISYGDYQYGFKSGLKATKQLLGLRDRPTAIFAISDILAIGAIRAAKEKKLEVPKDIAVVGFDNISYASMFNPMLTTISQPLYDLGSTAIDLLLKQMQGLISEPQEIFMGHEMLIRESTFKI